MAYYPRATGNDTQGIYEFFNYTGNVVSGGLMFPGIIFSIWIIVFLATKQFSTSRAWTFASFFCSVLSIILTILDLLAPNFMYLLIFFTAIGAAWIKLEAQ